MVRQRVAPAYIYPESLTLPPFLQVAQTNERAGEKVNIVVDRSIRSLVV